MLVACGAQAEVQVSVSVAPEAPCVTLESLSVQLQREGLIITDSGALDVDVSASAPGVRLRARRQDDGRLLVRAIPARQGKCEGVERALAMLIREWAGAPQLAPKSPPVPVPVPVRPKERPRVSVEPRLVEEPAVDAGTIALTEPVVIEAPPEEVDAGVSVPLEVEAPAPVAVPPVTWEVRLAVAGGLSALSTPNVLPAGTLVLDVGKEALGGSIDAAIEGEVVLKEAPGQVAVSVQWLTLAARWRFTWLERLSLDLGLGIRGSRLTATASGFTTNGSVTRYGFGPAAMGTLWFRVIGPLQALLRVSAALRLPAEELQVTNGPTFVISAGQLGLVAGLGIGWP